MNLKSFLIASLIIHLIGAVALYFYYNPIHLSPPHPVEFLDEDPLSETAEDFNDFQQKAGFRSGAIKAEGNNLKNTSPPKDTPAVKAKKAPEIKKAATKTLGRKSQKRKSLTKSKKNKPTLSSKKETVNKSDRQKKDLLPVSAFSEKTNPAEEPASLPENKEDFEVDDFPVDLEIKEIKEPVKPLSSKNISANKEETAPLIDNAEETEQKKPTQEIPPLPNPQKVTKAPEQPTALPPSPKNISANKEETAPLIDNAEETEQKKPTQEIPPLPNPQKVTKAPEQPTALPPSPKNISANKEETAPLIDNAEETEQKKPAQEIPPLPNPQKVTKAPEQQPADSSYSTEKTVKNFQDLQQKRGNPPLLYPDFARRAGMQGTMSVLFFVNNQGLVDQIQLRASSGHSELDNFVLMVLARYEFLPGQEGWIQHKISFRLEGEEQEKLKLREK